MESFDLMSSDHFHVVLHPNREHGIVFNRLDGTVTTINYDDAKELSNLKLIARTYGIVGRFLDKYLVLIKDCSRIGSLYEPDTKTDHDVFVINQVQIVDTSSVCPSHDPNVSTNASSRSNNSDSARYDVPTRNDIRHTDKLEEHELRERGGCDEFSSLPITITTNSYNAAQSRAAQWNPFKFANTLKPMVSSQLSALTNNSINQQSQSDNITDKSSGGLSQNPPVSTQQQILDDADKRLVDEMMKLFNNTNSFYFSPTLDLTNRFSKKCCKIRLKGNEPLWITANERYFWNRHMLKDLIELSKEDADANHFICIILQGFISIEHRSSYLVSRSQRLQIEEDKNTNPADDVEVGRLAIETTGLDSNSDNNNQNIQACDSVMTSKSNYEQHDPKNDYQLALVSRRSVFQAGTRYRRRGCDDHGNCANFVETEQIFRSSQHFTSMMIVRGSIPLFWHQIASLNYRPPPVLSRSEEENHEALSRHFEDLFAAYQTERIISVDCTEQTGREKELHDAFRQHIEKLKEKHPDLRLIEFDFHKYCRGRQCNDAQIELHLNACGLDEQLLKSIKYYWNDGDVVWNQEGVFRVNCLDCSDRTNVVQRNIALRVLDLQLARLGIIKPDTYPAENICRRIMQSMWSANGNVLSTQYCGTRALFGGDSKRLTGYLKDTYSSASRYYMSKFRDVYRQAAIDAMLGVESLETKNLKTGNVREQYEMLTFDPILAGRTGGALLRDMSNRVGNRLARLRGKLGQVRPFGHQTDESSLNTGTMSRFSMHPSSSSSAYEVGVAATGSAASEAGRRHFHHNDEMIETGLIETLGEMNIDWPNSESLENLDKHLAIASSADMNREKAGGREQKEDVFARFSNCDDCFQDDDFGQLMDDY